jgi:PAS domain S-box-containing protein
MAKILIIEDDHSVAEGIKLSLINMGYEICGCVSSGEEALAKAGEERPDLALADIKLEGEMDGIDTAVELRSQFQVPVVFLTAYADGQTLQRAKKAEPYGYLVKPFDGRELQATIENALHKHAMEMQLKESEERFRALFNAMTEGVALHKIINDSRGKPVDYVILDVNPAFQSHTGISVRAALGRRATEVYGTEQAPYLDIYGRVAATGESTRFDTYFAELHKYFSISAFSPCKGQFATVFSDITERKEGEEQVAKHHQELQQVLDSVVAQIWYLDTEGRVVNCNRTAEKATGIASQQARGHTMGSLLPTWDDPDRSHQESLTVARTGQPRLGAIESFKVDGQVRWASVDRIPWQDAKGNLIGVLLFIYDITDFKRAEEEQERLEGQLRQAQKMEAIGTLAGGIAHDFNNILGIIIGYAELAESTLADRSEEKENIEGALRACERARDLVKQILVFSRMESKVERLPLDLGSVIKETLKFLRASLPATLEIRQNISSDSLLALANEIQMHQLLTSLCTNAAHAMEETGGVLEVSVTDVNIDHDAGPRLSDLKPGPYIRLTVGDTGQGMDSWTQERIFDPYFTTKEVGKGSGLGLAVVQGIVKRHEGAITVHSETGKGTTVDVYLPRIESQEATEGQMEKPLPRGTERILFVDDDEVLAEIGKMRLQFLGYEVEATTSSIEALELFRAQPTRFDLLIADYTMPQMTGGDLAREMMQVRSDLGVILCTGFNEKISEEKARELGISASVLKPVTMGDLAETVRRVLDKM